MTFSVAVAPGWRDSVSGLESAEGRKEKERKDRIMNRTAAFINTLMAQGGTLEVPMRKCFEAFEAETLAEL